MVVSFISPRLYWFLNLGVCQLYPGYLTFLYLYGRRVGLTTSSENTVLKGVYYAHHFVYWAIYLLYSYAESLVPFHKVVPFYYELKLLFFFWLGSDHFRGAGYLFQTYFGTLVNHASAKLRSLLDTSVDEKTKDAVSDFLKNLGTFGDIKDSKPVRRQSPPNASGSDNPLRSESLYVKPLVHVTFVHSGYNSLINMFTQQLRTHPRHIRLHTEQIHRDNTSTHTT